MKLTKTISILFLSFFVMTMKSISQDEVESTSEQKIETPEFENSRLINSSSLYRPCLYA